MTANVDTLTRAIERVDGGRADARLLTLSSHCRQMHTTVAQSGQETRAKRIAPSRAEHGALLKLEDSHTRTTISTVHTIHRIYDA